MKTPLLQTLTLQGLQVAPSQVCGSLRLVPLLRSQVRSDLRLSRRRYSENMAVVSLENKATRPNLQYISYVPHGLVLSWNDDGSPMAAFGGQLGRDGKVWQQTRVMQRMVQRESKNQLRFLPLHLAMEGFLSMFFSGPAIAWSEYSRRVFSEGLNCRWELSYSGQSIAGFARALRLFEIHPKQVGVLVFVAEALASAFVVPTPEDYRALHDSLLADFYGELIYQYGLLYETTYPLTVSVDESKIDSLAALRGAIAQVREQWAEFQGFMAGDLLGRSLSAKHAYTAGPFVLQRFITDLDPQATNYIGEAIARDSGELEYLKTYRLSAAQTRRVYLLSQLAQCDWNLAAAATLMKISEYELVRRFEKAGFGYLFEGRVRDAARKDKG